MSVLFEDLPRLTRQNTSFRQVLATTSLSQIVVMSIPVSGEIGMESHNGDQIIFIVDGSAEAHLYGSRKTMKPGDCILIAKETRHNIVNVGNTDLKLYTVYTPPQH